MKLTSTTAMLLISLSLAGLPAQADSSRVYIPEGSANAIVIVDAGTGKAIGRITDVPAVHGLAGSPNSPYLVAGSYAETDREELDAMDRPATVSEDEHAAHHAMAEKPLGPPDAGISLLSIIDAASGEIVRRIELPGAVHHVAISPDGRFAVSTHPAGDGISVVDLTTLELSAWIPTGPLPNYAAFGADPGLVYVSNAGNGTVSEVDLGRGIVRRNMVTGDAPEHLTVDAAANRLFAVDAEAGRVVELDLADGRETRRFDIGGEIHGLGLADDRSQLFVAAKETDRMVAIDLGSGAISAQPLAPAPYHLATVPGAGTVFVSSREEPKVWIVDAATLKAKGEIAIEGEGHQMVVMHD